MKKKMMKWTFSTSSGNSSGESNTLFEMVANMLGPEVKCVPRTNTTKPINPVNSLNGESSRKCETHICQFSVEGGNHGLELSHDCQKKKCVETHQIRGMFQKIILAKFKGHRKSNHTQPNDNCSRCLLILKGHSDQKSNEHINVENKTTEWSINTKLSKCVTLRPLTRSSSASDSSPSSVEVVTSTSARKQNVR